jgi:preprotein translocase subunit SecB
MKSPLILDNYFFPVAQVISNPAAPEGVDVNDIQYTIKTHLAKSKSEDIYQVSVEIFSPPEDEEDIQQAYELHIVAVGLFRVAPDWPDPDRMLKVNGCSILYSSAREFLITITSRMPYGAVTLPTISFNNTKDEKQTEESTPKSKKRTKRVK